MYLQWNSFERYFAQMLPQTRIGLKQQSDPLC